MSLLLIGFLRRDPSLFLVIETRLLRLFVPRWLPVVNKTWAFVVSFRLGLLPVEGRLFLIEVNRLEMWRVASRRLLLVAVDYRVAALELEQRHLLRLLVRLLNHSHGLDSKWLL